MGDTLGVKFLVYRERRETGIYELVPGSNYTLLLSHPELTQRGCGSEALNSSQQFLILPNDIISACIIEDAANAINPLVIDSRSGTEARQVITANNPDPMPCSDNNIGVVDLNQLTSTNKKRRRLHLHASISK